MLIKDTTPYDLNKTLPRKLSLRRKFAVSYDINATNEFPNMSITTKQNKTKQNKTKQNKTKTHERTRDTMGIPTDIPTTATIPNEDNISTSLMKRTRQNKRISPTSSLKTMNLINLHSYKC